MMTLACQIWPAGRSSETPALGDNMENTGMCDFILVGGNKMSDVNVVKAVRSLGGEIFNHMVVLCKLGVYATS